MGGMARNTSEPVAPTRNRRRLRAGEVSLVAEDSDRGTLAMLGCSPQKPSFL
jgi:hypothetical protein